MPGEGWTRVFFVPIPRTYFRVRLTDGEFFQTPMPRRYKMASLGIRTHPSQ